MSCLWARPPCEPSAPIRVSCAQAGGFLSDRTILRMAAQTSEAQQLRTAITALEAQRGVLGDAVVDTALGPLR
jgi:hypothetical protein